MNKAMHTFIKLSSKDFKPGMQEGLEASVGGELIYSGAKSVIARKHPKVLVSYGYVKSLGGSHKALAGNVSSILNNLEIKDVDLVNSTNKEDLKKFFKNRKNYAHRIDAGWGVSSIFSGKTKTKLKTDLTPTNFVLGSDSKVESFLPGELHKKYNIPLDKKIITVSAGESGSFLDAKTKAVLNAVKDRKDTHVISLAANAKEEIKTNLKNMGVTSESFLPKNEFNKIISSSDLNINSGNPQTILDQLKFKNVNMNTYTPGYITEQNAVAATKKYGLPSADFKSEEFKTLINDLLDNPGKYKKSQEAGLKVYKTEADIFSRKLHGNIAKSIKSFKTRSMIKGVGLTALGAGLLYKGIADYVNK